MNFFKKKHSYFIFMWGTRSKRGEQEQGPCLHKDPRGPGHARPTRAPRGGNWTDGPVLHPPGPCPWGQHSLGCWPVGQQGIGQAPGCTLAAQCGQNHESKPWVRASMGQEVTREGDGARWRSQPRRSPNPFHLQFIMCTSVCLPPVGCLRAQPASLP